VNNWKTSAFDLAAALEKADLALNDWKVLLASEAYNEHTIMETHERVFIHGAVQYIGNVKAIIRKALDDFEHQKQNENKQN
jgi:hypothetical protein